MPGADIESILKEKRVFPPARTFSEYSHIKSMEDYERIRKEAEDIALKMTYMELSVSRNFMDEYMSALFLPHTDITLFPTVEKLISAQKNRTTS